MEKEKSFLRDGTKICETIFKFAILAFSFFETRERIEEEGGEGEKIVPFEFSFLLISEWRARETNATLPNWPAYCSWFGA